MTLDLQQQKRIANDWLETFPNTITAMTLDLGSSSTIIARLVALSKTIITMTLESYGNIAIKNDSGPRHHQPCPQCMEQEQRH